jgi:hypothetical protein
LTGLFVTGEADPGRVIALPSPTVDPGDHECTRPRPVIYVRAAREDRPATYSLDRQRLAIAEFVAARDDLSGEAGR